MGNELVEGLGIKGESVIELYFDEVKSIESLFDRNTEVGGFE